MTVELTPVTALGATYHFQDPSFHLRPDVSLQALNPLTPPPHSLTHPPTHTHTHFPLKICCIFVSSSGTISWCQACVVWSDSHALCGGLEGWMDAQSTIALINTNSYARCRQVSIYSARRGFSLGVVAAHFLTALRLSIFTFCQEKRNIVSLREMEKTEGPSANMRTSFRSCVLYLCWTMHSKPSSM